MVCSERLGAWNILWWGVRSGRVALFFCANGGNIKRFLRATYGLSLARSAPHS